MTESSRAFSPDTVSRPDGSLSMLGAERIPAIEKLFSILLFDLEAGEVIQNEDLDPAFQRQAQGRTGAAEYYFRVPPKVHSMGEPFTTHITPTQNGGKYIESHGSILKSVKVSGTTGLRPGRLSPKKIPLLGDVTVDDLKSLSGSDIVSNKKREVPEKEATGIDDIVFLRNLFRHYSDLKKDHARARSVVMVWRNARTDDYWIVEPKDFRLLQNARSPLVYNYEIQLTTISRLEDAISIGVDPQKNIKDRRRFFARVQKYNQTLTKLFLSISTNIRKLQGAGTHGISSITKPFINTLKGLNSIGDATYESTKGVTDHVYSLKEEIESELGRLESQLDRQDSLVRNLRRVVLVASNIISEPKFAEGRAASAKDRRRRIESSYDSDSSATSPARSPDVGGSRAFLGNAPRTNRVAQDIVGLREDIRQLAKRLLGDAKLWHVLVVLNDLRAPYIAAASSEGVLGPGDPILYPATRGGPSADLSYVNAVNQSDEELENNNTVDGPLQQAYGRDLRLVSKDPTTGLSDLSLNQRGDLSSIAGIPNVDQAIRLKFSTEQGELPSHPYFGSKFPIGRKNTSGTFHDFRINAIATIRSDPRIERIRSLSFLTYDDKLVLSMSAPLAHTRDLLETTFSLDRL